MKRLLHGGIMALCLAVLGHAAHKDDPHVEPKHPKVIIQTRKKKKVKKD